MKRGIIGVFLQQFKIASLHPLLARGCRYHFQPSALTILKNMSEELLSVHILKSIKMLVLKKCKV
jgi:hypothetical protein